MSRRRLLGFLVVVSVSPLVGADVVIGQAGAPGITLSEEILALGVEDGEPSQIFGDITGVITLRDGNILLLDGKAGVLSLFSPEGTLIDAAGRIGDGPGEFRNPKLVGVRHDSILVLDAMLRRISVFATASRGLSFVRTFGVSGWSADACLMGERLFLLAYSEGIILHEYSLDGTLLRSFGGPLGLDLPITRGGTIRGRLVCDVNRPMLYALSRQFGTVAAYSVSDGTHRWSVVPAGFVPAEMTPYDNGNGMRFGPGKGGITDNLVSGIVVTPNVILFQASRTQYRDSGSPGLGVLRSTRTFLIDASTGKALAEARSELPLILEAGNGHAWTVDTTDFPRIVRRRLQVSSQDH